MKESLQFGADGRQGFNLFEWNVNSPHRLAVLSTSSGSLIKPFSLRKLRKNFSLASTQKIISLRLWNFLNYYVKEVFHENFPLSTIVILSALVGLFWSFFKLENFFSLIAFQFYFLDFSSNFAMKFSVFAIFILQFRSNWESFKDWKMSSRRFWYDRKNWLNISSKTNTVSVTERISWHSIYSTREQLDEMGVQLNEFYDWDWCCVWLRWLVMLFWRFWKEHFINQRRCIDLP